MTDNPVHKILPMADLPDEWKDIYPESALKEIIDSIYDLMERRNVLPPMNNIFRIFDMCKPSQVRVVLLGQDPYPQSGVAHGLAFSVEKGHKIPSSLRNIQKEIQKSYPKCSMTGDGDLSNWAEQGVFLLNTVLTVNEGEAGSHCKIIGWEKFTDAIIKHLSDNYTGIVFLLFGRKAQAKASLIDSDEHCIIQTSHPSGLSCHRGFMGSECFKVTNSYLASKGLPQIDWAF